MKTKSVGVRVHEELDEDVIRDYAQHLYEQSGRIPGRDLDNWLEAKACLEANIPREHAHKRLQRHLSSAEIVDVCAVPVEAKNIGT